MAAATEKLLASTWAGGGERDIYADLNQLTLDIVTEVLFGWDIPRQQAQTIVGEHTWHVLGWGGFYGMRFGCFAHASSVAEEVHSTVTCLILGIGQMVIASLMMSSAAVHPVPCILLGDQGWSAALHE